MYISELNVSIDCNKALKERSALLMLSILLPSTPLPFLGVKKKKENKGFLVSYVQMVEIMQCF